MSDYHPILDFWFGQPDDEEWPDKSHTTRWWSGGPELDQEIEQEFGDQVRQALAGELNHWASEAAGSLALVVLLDQFTRNIHRATGDAFSGDTAALAIARNAVKNGQDADLHPAERVFLYMPFEHSESMADQNAAVTLMQALRDETPVAIREQVEGSLDFAEQHRDVIRRFGRFPHRNVLLGRESTPEEQLFLESEARSWGQGSKS